MSNLLPEKPDAAFVRTAANVAADLLLQPEFFAAHREELPEPSCQRPDLNAPRYSGARSNDEELNLRVGAMRLLGFSDRAIERECGIDRRTIPHRLNWLEQTRRIPAVKDRVAALTSNLAESSALALGVLLDRAQGEVSVELAAMIKAVATAHGITVEKMQLLTGQATEIVETRSGAGRADFESWWQESVVPIQATVTAADDSASPSRPLETAQNAAAQPAGHTADTPTQPTSADDPEPDRGGGDRPNNGGPPGATGQ